MKTASSLRHRRRIAFTTVELLVSMGIMLVAMASVVSVFNISSTAAGRTAAHSEMLGASAGLQQVFARELNRLAPGVLIIESPAPTLARAETRHGNRLYRLRHDRLVFLASGAAEAYQSFTHPPYQSAPGAATTDPATSRHVLNYFGPGIPISSDAAAQDFDDETKKLPANEWVFCQRSILLLASNPDTSGTWTPPTMSEFVGNGMMMDGGALYVPYREGSMDAVVSEPNFPAEAAKFAEVMMAKSISGLVPPFAALWEPSLAPVSAQVSTPADADYYTRSGFNLVPRMADFRIEWTDGRPVDPLGSDGNPNSGDEDMRTRWFGLRPDPTVAPDLLNPDTIPYFASRRQDVTSDTTPAETAAFRDQIEWSVNGSSSGADSTYRAVWRNDTWHLKPKALRLTYRLYDAGDRLKQTTTLDLNEDGVADLSGAQTAHETRFGIEYSTVVELPS